jgi:hypothetical protein
MSEKAGEKKGVGKKILSIFVENEGAPEPTDPEKSPAEIVAELAAPVSNLKLDKLSAPAAGAPADFDAIFRDAGMDVADLDRVKKAEELLKSLPEGTPQPVKKQIVEASLKAFGFEVVKIVSAAQTQQKALDTYARVNEQATAKAISDAEAQIRSLNEKIAALRADIEKRTAGLSSLSLSAQKRKGEVQRVLEFFEKQEAK